MWLKMDIYYEHMRADGSGVGGDTFICTCTSPDTSTQSTVVTLGLATRHLGGGGQRWLRRPIECSVLISV